MIIDRIENASKYWQLGERIQKALEYLAAGDFRNFTPGKYEVDGNCIFALVNEYDSKPENICKPEAHEKYIDIQFIVEGEECIGLTLLTNQVPTEAYNQEKDITFYKVPTSLVKFEAGMFGIFFPHDIHQPCVMVEKPAKVKKVVLKVRVGE